MNKFFKRSKKSQMKDKYQELKDDDDVIDIKDHKITPDILTPGITNTNTNVISDNELNDSPKIFSNDKEISFNSGFTTIESLDLTEDSNCVNSGIDIKTTKETIKKPNKIMKTLNLSLNTTIFKKILINKIEHLNLNKKVSISTSYISLCLVSEYLMEKLIKLSYSDDIVENDKFGLKSSFNYIKLENEILKNNDFKNNFIKYVYNFDKSKNYYDLMITGNIVRTFAKTKIDKSIILDKDLVNFICYVINDVINSIIVKSLNTVIYMKRKQLKPDIIKFVVSHEFTEQLYKKMEINLDKIAELKINSDVDKETDDADNDD